LKTLCSSINSSKIFVSTDAQFKVIYPIFTPFFLKALKILLEKCRLAAGFSNEPNLLAIPF